MRFSFDKLLIKFSCRKLWVWAVSSAFIFVILLKNGQDHAWVNTLAIGQIIMSGAYILGNVIEKIAVILANKTDINLGGR